LNSSQQLTQSPIRVEQQSLVMSVVGHSSLSSLQQLLAIGLLHTLPATVQLLMTV
jgi:hypothetical protein